MPIQNVVVRWPFEPLRVYFYPAVGLVLELLTAGFAAQTCHLISLEFCRLFGPLNVRVCYQRSSCQILRTRDLYGFLNVLVFCQRTSCRILRTRDPLIDFADGHSFCLWIVCVLLSFRLVYCDGDLLTFRALFGTDLVEFSPILHLFCRVEESVFLALSQRRWTATYH